MKFIDIVFETVVDMYEGKPPMTRDEFIRRSQEIHQDENGNPKYNYDKVDYKTANTKVTITCPIHGDFLQLPGSHLSGVGCAKCSSDRKKSSKDNFVKRAQEVHQDENGNPLYGYDNVNYLHSKDKVSITCPIHGEFLQSPNKHLQGGGCPKCGLENKRMSQDEFIKRGQQIHQDENGNPLYGYDKVHYINNNTKVIITCPKHGEFLQSPESHLSGIGCRECWKDSLKLTKDQFINKAKEVHQNENGDPEYNYDKVQYVDSQTKVIITCPKHGDFLQKPNNHLQGSRCPKCSESKGEKTVRNYFNQQNIEFKEQEKFESCFRFSDKQKKCFKLPFDFYLREKNTLIEVDGDQHFKPLYGNSRLDRQIITDNLKNKFVQTSNNKLIRLYYNGNNYDYLISELDRLLKDKSPNKIILSKNYPKLGWNK